MYSGIGSGFGGGAVQTYILTPKFDYFVPEDL
jgi:hypothetical protein